MGELEKSIEEQASSLIKNHDTEQINGLIEEKVRETEDVKSAIDLFATKTALQQEETRDKVVKEKQEELRNDAEAKRIQAETERINKEVEKVKQEKEKELAELDKIIATKRAVVDQLNTESDISKAFFESNKDILKYIGIREKKSLGTMKFFMVPAIVVFIIVQILLFPLTFCGLLLETVVGIVGGVCGAIKNNALKIIMTIFVILIVATVGFLAYYFAGKYIFK